MPAFLPKSAEEVESRRSERVTKFWELARDPELSSHVALLCGECSASKRSDFIPPAGFKSGNKIREALINLELPTQFTSNDILNALLHANFSFSSKDHKGAVQDALFNLSRGDEPEFKIVRKGAGGKPNLYQRIMKGF